MFTQLSLKWIFHVAVMSFLFAALWREAKGLSPFVPNDPLYAQQWNLNRQESVALVDANLFGAWSQGWTGSGVVIGIAEYNAIDAAHPDLASNYLPGYDLGRTDVYDPNGDSHATEVAGVAAARGDNGIGMTGAAPYASLVSLGNTPFNGNVSFSEYDSTSAAIVRHRNDVIDIKNWSFGLYTNIDSRYPESRFLRMPQYEQALLETESSGLINVRSAMNNVANANWFGDHNVFGAIVVGGTHAGGWRSWYSNYGANLMVSAPTNGTNGEFPALQITATVGGGSYVDTFGGTSAAAPLVSGVLALAKEAQPNLNSRFAKHLLAMTSQLVDAENATRFMITSSESQLPDPTVATPIGGWVTNGAGHHFNNLYGFGLIDAGALVSAAQQYVGVSPLVQYSTGNVPVSVPVPEDGELAETFSIPGGVPVEDLKLDYSLSGAWISSIEISITSPSGTTNVLWDAYKGAATSGYRTRDWSLITNAFWGEDPGGDWTVRFRDLPWAAADEAADIVTLNSFGVVARLGSLVAAGPGDFNADGVVDAADYMQWRDNFGSTTSLAADDSGNGIVDAADYVIWRAHVGSGIGSVLAVPEPQVVFLLAGSSMLLIRRLRQSRITRSTY